MQTNYPNLFGCMFEHNLKAPSLNDYMSRREAIKEEKGLTEENLTIFDGLLPQETPIGSPTLNFNLFMAKKDSKEWYAAEQALYNSLTEEERKMKDARTGNTGGRREKMQEKSKN